MKNGIARSPLFYVGDKYKLIQEIKTYFPEKIGRFIEPFVGGGSVFMNVNAESYILNDIDYYVIAIHKMLGNYIGKSNVFFEDFFSLIHSYGLSLSYQENTIPNILKKEFPKTYFAKYNKNAYTKMKYDFNSSEEKNALLLYALLIYGFNRMLRFNKKGEFNLPVGDVDFNQKTYDALNDYFQVLENRHIHWYNQDFKIFLNSIKYQKDDFVYLDPPYLITHSEYNKLWNENMENILLSLLDNLNKKNIKFAISNVTHYKGNVNNIFINWSTKYISYPIKSNYISFNDNSIKQIKEVLVTNF